MTQSRTHWLALLLTSAVLAALLHALRMPASVLLGCMAAGIWMGYRGHGLALPKPTFAVAQAFVACLIAHSLQWPMLQRLAGDWTAFVGVNLSVIAASAGLGWLLMRLRILPGSTAVWGLAPGAASVMVGMSEDFGADVRLVAFMQYLRVVMVTALATLVAHAGSSYAPHATPEVQWLQLDSAWNVGCTVVVALGSALLARRWHIPGGSMLLPLGLSVALEATGLYRVELPPLLLGLAYALLGWSIGLRFTRASLLYAWKVLPHVTVAILALMVLGLLHAVLLHYWVGLDVLTAYLATSPGGADSVAVIAATSAVDAGFVMAMQMARFVMVLLLGPLVFKWVAGLDKPPKP
jgi:membrane AbrB-like protein